MRYLYLLLALFIVETGFGQAQTENYTVQLYATITPATPEIQINWQADANATSYTIYRKHPDSTSWGNALRTQPALINYYIDRNVSKGVAYDYRVDKTTPNYTATGYLRSGIEVPPVENRGKLILIADLQYSSILRNDIDQLKLDLEGDGWNVIERLIHNQAPDTTVKRVIVQEWNKDKDNVKAVYLLGHLAVPMSGTTNMAPDGVTDNFGAWPADAFYSDVRQQFWPDLSYTWSRDLRRRNIRGDGKYDRDITMQNAELAVGRVDFSQFTYFAKNEAQLMSDYLKKARAYKFKEYSPRERALIDDNLGVNTAGQTAKAEAAYRTFANIVGTSIDTGDFRAILDTADYLLAYVNGTGTNVSLSGAGTSQDLATDSLLATFALLHGEQFGDFDRLNNYMRSMLAQGNVLNTMWSGSPYTILHPLGLGGTMGECMQLSWNNRTTYDVGGQFEGYVHQALMGDPTMRARIVGPPDNLVASNPSTNLVELNWTASTDNIVGYNIYRKKKYEDFYERLNDTAIVGTDYIDSCVVDSGDYVYMVRALKLEEVAAGSYYNLSQGIFDSLTLSNSLKLTSDFSVSVSQNTANLTNLSNTSTIYWEFGDGNNSNQTSPSHPYGKNGTYDITQVSIKGCNSDTVVKSVDIDYFRPDAPSNLRVSDLGSNYHLIEWDSSSSFINGYNVYRREYPNGFFQILTNFGFWDKQFLDDSCLVTPGDYEYMVTAFKRDTFRNGVKPNFSDSITYVYNITQDYSVKADFSYTTNADTIFFNNLSAEADSFIWDYGTGFGSNDENPYYNLGQNRTINVKLVSIGPCGIDSITKAVELTTVGILDPTGNRFGIYPNPAKDRLTISVDHGSHTLRLYDIAGRMVRTTRISEGENQILLDDLSAGEYLLEINSGKALRREKLIISK